MDYEEQCSKEETDYAPIKYVELSSQKISFPDYICLYRNNLTALSQQYNFLFVAIRDQVHVYSPQYPNQKVDREPLLVLNGLPKDVELRTRGYIPPQISHSINHLIVAELGNEEVLVTADDDGYVCMWYTSRLEEYASQLADFWFDVSDSAWGLSVHKEKRLLAVSANTKIISVFELGLEGIKPDASTGGPTSPIRMVASDHNLPSVSFLQDASGRWIAATDIDGTIILIDLLKNETLAKYRLRGQGWSVNLISENSFKYMDKKSLTHLMRWGRVPDQDESGSESEHTADVLSDSDEDQGSLDVVNTESDEFPEDSVSSLDPTVVASSAEVPQVGDSDDPYHYYNQSLPDRAYGNLLHNMMSKVRSTEWHCVGTKDILRCGLRDHPPPCAILHTTEYNFQLFDVRPRTTMEILQAPQQGYSKTWEYLHPDQAHEDIIPYDPPDDDSWLMGLLPRLNMVYIIPSLSLYIVARQDGYVTLIRLLRHDQIPTNINRDSVDGVPETDPLFAPPTSVRWFMQEHILPEELPGPLSTPLAGIAVSPMQGWHAADQRRRSIGVSIGEGQLGSQGGRHRLMLIYADGTILSYELYTKSKSHKSDKQ